MGRWQRPRPTVQVMPRHRRRQGFGAVEMPMALRMAVDPFRVVHGWGIPMAHGRVAVHMSVVRMGMFAAHQHHLWRSHSDSSIHVRPGRQGEQTRSKHHTQQKSFLHDRPPLGRLTHCGRSGVSELLGPCLQTLQTATVRYRRPRGAGESSPPFPILAGSRPPRGRTVRAWPDSCRRQWPPPEHPARSSTLPSSDDFRWLA